LACSVSGVLAGASLGLLLGLFIFAGIEAFRKRKGIDE